MSQAPTLKIHINGWSLLDEADPATEEGLRTHLSSVKEAGFQGYSWFANTPNQVESIYDIREKKMNRYQQNNKRDT